jgi:hypothetical protein
MTTGTITSNITSGITLPSGDYDTPLTIASGVSIGGTYAVYLSHTAWSIQNEGTISASKYGILFGYSRGTVTNDGTISGGVYGGIGQFSNGGGPVSIVNSGVIESSSNSGINLDDAGSVTNGVTGTISGYTAGLNIDGAYGGPATVVNAGTISGNLADGVHLAGSTDFVNNSGSIGSQYNRGVYAGGTATIENSGAISGGSIGIQLQAGGTISNAASGTITGIVIAGGAGTIDNAGTISTGNNEYFSPEGHPTFIATYGVAMNGGGTLFNEHTGTISGGKDGVYFGGGASSATVENAGTIIGTTHAVDLEAATNRLIVDAGADFIGDVVARAASANTLELTGTNGAGTINGLGAQYQNFQTITIDSGATWSIAGTVAGFESATVQGFTSNDRLDLTDLSFSGANSVTLNGADQLVIADNGGNVTIQLTGSFTGDFFHLSNDGGGQTLLTEDTTPCYLRGTRIRTSSGDAAIETLRIGDLVMTAADGALPVKWIGRCGYRDWLAVGNAKVQPILFKKGAIADGVPARDLYVSPEHAMFLNGMLVPARHLVNGASILKCDGMEEVEYFHLEFDRHAVIFAEGAAAESFVDDDSRTMFHNAEEYCRLYPNELHGERRATFCAPRLEAGYALETLHRALAARAAWMVQEAAETTWRGHLDLANRAELRGWAFAETGPVTLAILVNGAVIGRTVADRGRADLRAAGLGDCAFRFTLPRPLPSWLTHRIEVRRERDWTLLPGGAMTLNPDVPKAAA